MRFEQKSVVKEWFNHIANGYASKRDIPEIIRERIRILSLIADFSRYEKRILDIGCGDGAFLDALLNIGGEIHAIDVSERMIELVHERFQGHPEGYRLHLDVGDFLTVEYPVDFFDLVLAIGVLRYMSSWEMALAKIRRILKPGGILVATFYYRFSPWWFSMCLLYRPILPIISLLRRRSFKSCLLRYDAEPLPFSYSKFMKLDSGKFSRNLEISSAKCLKFLIWAI